MAQPTMGLRTEHSVAPSQLFSQTGIAAGSTVLTAQGEVPVEALSTGDRIISRDTGMVQVTEVRRYKLNLPAILIKGGALGNSQPDADMVVGSDQPVLLRDWRAQAMFRRKSIIVAAAKLCDGEFILPLDHATTEVYQILCDAPHILYINGIEIGCAGTLPENI